MMNAQRAGTIEPGETLPLSMLQGSSSPAMSKGLHAAAGGSMLPRESFEVTSAP